MANAQYPVSGELSANVSVSGTQLDPAGSGSLQLANGRAYDEPIQTIALKFHAENGSIVSNLDVTSNAGPANSTLPYTPKTKAYKVRLDAPSIALQKLPTAPAKNLAVHGTPPVSASGQRPLRAPP